MNRQRTAKYLRGSWDRELPSRAYSKESAQLLAALDLGLFDKGQKDTLTDTLNLRNKCGHPSKYRPGSKKVSAFVEYIVSAVFT